MIEDYIKEMNIVYDEKKVQEKLREYRETNNIKIRNEIIEMCLPLILHSIDISGKYVDVSKEDIYSYACEGLMYAIDKYDVSFNTLFRIYAMNVIRSKIILGASRASRISPKNHYMHFLEVKNEVEEETGKSLSNNIELLDLILERMMDYYLISGTTADTIKKSYVVNHCLSYEEDISGVHSSSEEIDEIENEIDSQIFADRHFAADSHLLTDKEKHVLRLLYGFDGEAYSQAEVNRKLNMGRNAANSIASNALSKLKRVLKNRF